MITLFDENFEPAYTEGNLSLAAGAGSMIDEAAAGANDNDDGTGIGHGSYAEFPSSFSNYFGDVY
jgi:hypothetical protein